MTHRPISIRPFIGAENFDVSRRFYTDLGFEETIISRDMSVFKIASLAFYLQDAYVKDWIDNTMVFVEVDDVQRYWNELSALNLPAKYGRVKLSPIHHNDWGSEYFLHDPSGVLWHFGVFKK